jgi:hypothetical protein
MATRIENILTRARRTLADREGDRWSDDDLLSFLSDGQRDLNMQLEILQSTFVVDPVETNSTFNLPTDCWKLSRITYLAKALPLVTHTALDNITLPDETTGKFVDVENIAWEAEEGVPRALIWDRREFYTGKIYPIPNEDIAYTSQDIDGVYGFVSTDADEDSYGLVSYIEDDLANEQVISIFGVISELFTTDKLKCYYLRDTTDATDLNSTLEVPHIYDTALQYYVIGNAFLTDNDSGYKEKASTWLTAYANLVEQYNNKQSRDQYQADILVTSYKRVI